jgi:predicted ATP-grasp superfamily ATP-dependent carboligase
MSVQRIFVYEHLSGGGLQEPVEADLLAQGRAMRDAMVQDLARIPGVQLTCALAPGEAAALPAGVRAANPAEGESAFDFVRRQALQHDLAWVVAPECEGLLACLRKVVGQQRWLGCDSASIRLASSKSATLEVLARHGIVTPFDFFHARDVVRWVVKPDDGAGAVDTQVFGTLAAALDHLAGRQRARAWATLEPWVEGEAMSLSLLCRGDGRADLLCCNRQDVRVGEGGVVRYEGVRNAIDPGAERAAALRRVAQQVAQAMPGLRGFAGIDLVWHAQRGPVVIEVNPRVTSAYVGLSAALRRPQLAGEILAVFGAPPPQAREPARAA